MRIALPILLVLTGFGFGRESISMIHPVSNYVRFNMSAELRDDVYSADMEIAGEFAPCNCFAIYGDFSYRIVSYEWDTELHDQIHEMVNLRVNGFNETYLGMKFMPYRFFGIDVSWRFPPGEGSQVNRFHRLGIEPMGLYEFSKTLKLGVSAAYYTFLESDDFKPGDEVGLKGSLEWNLAQWDLVHVFVYRWRIQESENLHMDKPYQKMNDLYQGFRMRTDVGRNFAVGDNGMGVFLFYEMNRGSVFGAETGHTIGLYGKFKFL